MRTDEVKKNGRIPPILEMLPLLDRLVPLPSVLAHILPRLSHSTLRLPRLSERNHVLAAICVAAPRMGLREDLAVIVDMLWTGSATQVY